VTELWESSWIEIHELMPMGDHVVVPHTSHVRGRDGIEAQALLPGYSRSATGRSSASASYQDKQEALDAAGLGE
jgi:hypothetical protein